jgi:L-lactate dehydrogenase complex protein LldG
MNQAKANIFNRLHQAQATETTLSIKSTKLPFHPWGWQGKNQQDKLDRFVSTLTASHAEVMTLPSDKLSDTLHQLAANKGWHHAAIGTQGEHIQAFHLGFNNIHISEFSQQIENWKSELFNHVDVGITHTLGAIADTGTLVIWPIESEPRTLSLVPPCHVAIVHQSQIYCHFLEMIQAQDWANSMPTNALLISGPSKTADIQQTLAYGAHGPSELIVLLIEDK